MAEPVITIDPVEFLVDADIGAQLERFQLHIRELAETRAESIMSDVRAKLILSGMLPAIDITSLCAGDRLYLLTRWRLDGEDAWNHFSDYDVWIVNHVSDRANPYTVWLHGVKPDGTPVSTNKSACADDMRYFTTGEGMEAYRATCQELRAIVLTQLLQL